MTCLYLHGKTLFTNSSNLVVTTNTEYIFCIRRSIKKFNNAFTPKLDIYKRIIFYFNLKKQSIKYEITKKLQNVGLYLNMYKKHRNCQ